MQEDNLEKDLLTRALQETFKRRATHDLPKVLSPPPKEWITPFLAMAQECALSIGLDDAFLQLQDFWQKTLSQVR
jgi:hypothetical protein